MSNCIAPSLSRQVPLKLFIYARVSCTFKREITIYIRLDLTMSLILVNINVFDKFMYCSGNCTERAKLISICI